MILEDFNIASNLHYQLLVFILLIRIIIGNGFFTTLKKDLSNWNIYWIYFSVSGIQLPIFSFAHWGREQEGISQEGIFPAVRNHI